MVNEVTKPISESRVRECEVSARFWATEIGPYAERMRKRADHYAIISALLSALTGLGVWSTLVTSTQWLAVLAVSLVALFAAAVSVIPQIKRYGQCAGAATSLGPRYGHALGELMDALEMLRTGHSDGSSRARQAVELFEKVKAAKDSLRPYPAELHEKINAIRASEPADEHRRP